jgi:hypothetical protein
MNDVIAFQKSLSRVMIKASYDKTDFPTFAENLPTPAVA